MSTALRAASSACSEPSVASRILVGKMLIVTLSFPVGPRRGICADCIKILVRHKGPEMAQRCSRGATEALSPRCLEGTFYEVRNAKQHSSNGRLTPYGRSAEFCNRSYLSLVGQRTQRG